MQAWCLNYSYESYTYTQTQYTMILLLSFFLFCFIHVLCVYVKRFFFHHCIEQRSCTTLQENNKNIWVIRNISAFSSLNRNKIEGVCRYGSGNHKENIILHNTCSEFNAHPVFLPIYKLSLSCLLTGSCFYQ